MQYSIRSFFLVQVSRTLLGAALCALSLSAPVQADMVIPGKFAVSPVGAATYNIPIQVPPGIGGIEPNLSLSYNSRSGNGLLGVGWSLNGLSAITRCPQTNPQDTNRTGINYTSSDRFCLDGKRLIALVAGTDGAPNSEYRTEIDDFSKVVAYGTAAGGGPSYFVVKTKDGRTLEYGNTTSSSIAVAGLSPQVIRTWALDKINDSKGNTLTVNYTQDTTSSAFNGGYYPASISYTSNSSTGLAATNSVVFSYDLTRTDQISGYQGGYAFLNRARMTAITTQTNNTNVLTYALSYGAGPSSGRSRLTSVGLCSASGTCLPTTTVSYPSDSTPGPVVQTQTISGDSCLMSCNKWAVLDINNDGWADLVHFKSVSQYAVWINNHNGTFSASVYTQNVDGYDPYYYGNTVTYLTLDVDGDGLMDIVHITSGPMYVWKSKGDGTFSISSFDPKINDKLNGQWIITDINGDGLLDMVYAYRGANTIPLYIYLSNGNGTFTLKTTDTGLSSSSTPLTIMDANGDGRSDVIVGDIVGNRIFTLFSNGDGTFSTTQQTSIQNNGGYLQIDINGDGLMDWVQLTGNPRVFVSKGNGTYDQRTLTNDKDPYSRSDYQSNTVFSAGFMARDYHGSGLFDLLHYYSAAVSGYSYLWASHGDGTFAVTTFANGSLGESTNTSAYMLPGDFWAEGRLQQVRMVGDTTYETWSANSQTRDIPSAITDGIGKSVQWSGDTLTKLSSNSYSRTLANTATTQTLAPALPVVTSVKVNDASGGQRETRYSYDSARFEPLGRGFLGFNWVQSQNTDTGIVNRTLYRLDFPYLGMVSQLGTGPDSGTGWNYYNLTTNTWSCINPANNAACTVSAGNHYFIYPSQIDTVPTDLGIALPRTRVQNLSLDAFGNAGTVVTTTLNPDGSASGYSKTATNTYYNDTTNWYLGRLLKSSVVSASPVTMPTAVTPGSGGLAAAPAPTYPTSLPPGLSQIPPATLIAILGLLLN